MSPALQADLVVAVHLCVVAFMVAMTVGVPVALGVARLRDREVWAWARSPVLRWPHLAISLYMAVNAMRGELCFLTTWERSLRYEAGQWSEESYSFVGRILHRLLYVDVPQAVLDTSYVALFVITTALAFLLPPRRLRRSG